MVNSLSSKIQIRSDAHRSRDAGSPEHITDHGHGHHPGRVRPGPVGFCFVQMQIPGALDEGLVDGVT